MNKTELVKKVAAENALSQKQAAAVVDSVLDAVVDTVAAGEPVALLGFGTFSVKHRDARQGRNPATGEAMDPCLQGRQGVQGKGQRIIRDRSYARKELPSGSSFAWKKNAWAFWPACTKNRRKERNGLLFSTDKRYNTVRLNAGFMQR